MAVDQEPPSTGPRLTVAEQLAHSTVRLEVTFGAAGVGTGTGFFYSFAREGEVTVPAIVTNRHVVAEGVTGRFHLTLRGADGGPRIGKTVAIDLGDFQRHWHGHPDPTVDLCAMPIAPLLKQADAEGKSVFYVTLDETLVPSDAELQQLDLLEDITMVGYPIGLWDEVNNMPVFRRGTTATHPALDWNGRPEFMIDAACFPGSSGSPVLLHNKSGYTDKHGNMILGGGRLKLLGVLHAGPVHLVDGKISIVPIPTAARQVVKTQMPLNLGFVIKARALHALDAYFKAARKKPR